MARGSRSKKKRGGRRRSPAAELTDDLLVEILSRAPYKSVCRSRCVCKRWDALISHPDHRRRLPQSLVGFFYTSYDAARFPEKARHFANASPARRPAVDPSLSFLPAHDGDRLRLLDSCNGLLLCRCFGPDDSDEFNYVVVHPAAERWVVVPGARRWTDKRQHTVRLGFDPAVSSHFHVFEFETDDDQEGAGNDDGEHAVGAKIYSSETRAWSHKNSGWEIESLIITIECRSVFLDGMLYSVADDTVIAAVDVEGKNWRIIEMPQSEDPNYYPGDGFIGLSQGRLYFANPDDVVTDKLAIWVLWVLEDSVRGKWTLKHTVSFMHLVGRKHVHFGFGEFIVISIHPERNLVFFVFGGDKTLMSYDMDSGNVRVIRVLGRNCEEPYLPYVHLLSESLADGK
ncbi:hypothetical protein ACP4OV_023214 [Aristida adscensionis]